MRARVLPLPEVTLGEAIARPFVLVVDRLQASSIESFEMLRESWEEVKVEIGARLPLISAGEDIELDPTAIEADPSIVDRLVALAGA